MVMTMTFTLMILYFLCFLLFYPKLNLTKSGKELDGVKNGNKQYLTISVRIFILEK